MSFPISLGTTLVLQLDKNTDRNIHTREFYLIPLGLISVFNKYRLLLYFLLRIKTFYDPTSSNSGTKKSYGFLEGVLCSKYPGFFLDCSVLLGMRNDCTCSFVLLETFIHLLYARYSIFSYGRSLSSSFFVWDVWSCLPPFFLLHLGLVIYICKLKGGIIFFHGNLNTKSLLANRM